MEQFLDTRTLAFISGSILAVLCIIMLTEYFSHKIYAGFAEWIAANIFLGTGLILLSLRGLLPDFISIVAANAMILVYCQLLSTGLAKFFSLKYYRRLDFAVAAGYLGLIIYYTYVSPEITARIALVSVLFIIYCLRCAWLIKQGARLARFSVNRLLIWIFYTVAGWFCLRVTAYLYWEHQITDLMAGSTIEGITYAIGICTYIFLTTGLIQLNTGRIERELLDAQEEIRTISGFLPICAYCKNVRDDDGYWKQLEAYISSRTDAQFSHGICPDCLKEHFPEYLPAEEE